MGLFIGVSGVFPLIFNDIRNVFIILAKKTPSSRNVKGRSLVSRWEMNWLRTRDGKSHLNCSTGSKVLLDKLS
ncbi:hypothetical protein FC701_15145 [Bacillus mycoides]|uniref:Uncharacterized protein n=1 Tax=Bacillus mycoides TaxID=1405 RepID=A0A4U3A9U3_BACMY|nr:hypothetical protein FC701_15145 [Bacillus mycoides]